VAPNLFVGTSGWTYPSWKPGFYPEAVSGKNFLRFYASQLNSVEVNYTFRKLPTAAMVERWLAESPAGFRFSFKAPQRITHFNRLRECDALLTEFFAALQPVAKAGKLGPALFQLPPNFKADLPRLSTFLALPALRRKSAPRVAFEFRHPSWFTDETAALLRRRNASFCIAETDELTTPEIHTASSFTCFRLRRGGGYTPREIAAFAKRFLELAQTHEVFAYFRHEDEPTGALNAAALLRRAAR
jgi:uncharacterized protein YecE (DUF72 family)